MQALGNAACRRLIPVRYTRLADMFAALDTARARGTLSYRQQMDVFRKVPLLIMDDFLTTPIDSTHSVELFEIMEAREGRGATLIASQLEPQDWYLRITGGEGVGPGTVFVLPVVPLS